MNHHNFVREVSALSGRKISDADAAVDATLAVIKKQLQSVGYVNLRFIGKLFVTRKGPRNGRNPRTGAVVPIPERNVVRFKASSKLEL